MCLLLLHLELFYYSGCIAKYIIRSSYHVIRQALPPDRSSFQHKKSAVSHASYITLWQLAVDDVAPPRPPSYPVEHYHGVLLS
jgi:hypothetical protein